MLTILFAAFLLSTDPKLEEFTHFATELHEKNLLNGEVMIARGDQIELHLKEREDMQFMIGSVSKQFFAVALLKALYETSSLEKLSLPLSNFLPNLPAWASQVTLHHLLTHTSGILNYTDTEEFRNGWLEFYHTPADIIDLIREKSLSFTPGSQFAYCNTGYVLIAEVLEAITSMPAAEYLKKALFDPLELHSTFHASRGKWDEFRLPPPYKYDQERVYPFLHCEDMSVVKGAGSIISTSKDLLKWNLALHQEQSVLPQELYRLFTTPEKENYGYGINIDKRDDYTLLGHGGGVCAYRTLLHYIPEERLSIIILTHTSYDYDQPEGGPPKRGYEALINHLKDL